MFDEKSITNSPMQRVARYVLLFSISITFYFSKSNGGRQRTTYAQGAIKMMMESYFSSNLNPFLTNIPGAQPIMRGSVKPWGELGPPNEIESYAPALLYCARMHFWKDSSGIFLNSFRNLNVKQTSLRILLAIRHKSFNKIPNSQHQWRRHGGGKRGNLPPPPPPNLRSDTSWDRCRSEKIFVSEKNGRGVGLHTEKKLHPESYFWSFSTLVPGIIKR